MMSFKDEFIYTEHTLFATHRLVVWIILPNDWLRKMTNIELRHWSCTRCLSSERIFQNKNAPPVRGTSEARKLKTLAS
jgi:hypothetical protein